MKFFHPRKNQMRNRLKRQIEHNEFLWEYHKCDDSPNKPLSTGVNVAPDPLPRKPEGGPVGGRISSA